MMRKVELLAPAGTMESLHAAVQCGCDAVYLGGTMFGARAYAGNFDDAQMKEAIRYAHIHGVRVYVTMNTLLDETEIDAAFDYARFLYEHDVDALIIQDLGLAERVHTQLPDLELHASTQMHIHNRMGIETARRLGMKRVVLPRESTIEEIRAAANLGMDLEVFVHGALCMSYSGQCLMSAALFGRSGNRGECAQPCRMRYALIERDEKGERQIETPGEYLLSPRDLMTIDQLPALIDAGVLSFKIEGRMKSAEYVAQTVSLYRRAIDAYLAQRPWKAAKEDVRGLEKVFSRGFTSGHMFHQPGQAMMNPFRPNHMGIKLGVVESVSKTRIRIRLSADLHQGDGIRILQDHEDQGCMVNRIWRDRLLVSGAKAGELVEIDRKIHAYKGNQVVKTQDVRKQQELRELVSQGGRKCAVDVLVTLCPGQAPACRITDEEGNLAELTLSDVFVQPAQKAPLSEQRLREQFEKMTDTPFKMRRFACALQGDCFLPMKEINRLRRGTLEILEAKRAVRHDRKGIQPDQRKLTIQSAEPLGLFAIVQDETQYRLCQQFGIKTIITARKALFERLRQAGENIGFHEGNIVHVHGEACMGGENGALAAGRPIIDATLNLSNSYAVGAAASFGVKTMVLSDELDAQAISALARGCRRYAHVPDLACLLYGHIDLMTSRTCVVNTWLRDGTKKGCRLCREHQYILQDQKGRRFMLNNDEQCNMRVLSPAPLDRIHALPELRQAGIRSFCLRFTREDARTVQQVLDELSGQLA